MKRLLVVLASSLLATSCSANRGPSHATDDRPTIAVTYSVLGSLVSELVGEQARVTVVIPDGQDPHDFEPSAKDIEAINEADLIVSNGLNFEEGLTSVLDSADNRGVPHFVVTDHVTTRVGDGSTTTDPHVWLSPHAMVEMIDDLSTTINTKFGLDLTQRTASLVDEEVRRIVTECFARAADTLLREKPRLIALAETLLRRESLDEREMLDVTGLTGVAASKLSSLSYKVINALPDAVASVVETATGPSAEVVMAPTAVEDRPA